jgi:K+-sensing histidine kinase KdpD
VSSDTIPPVRIVLGLVGAVLLIGLVTFVALAVGANATTVGFAYLILILGISIFSGLTVGLLSSIAATACFNYYFLPPVRTWVIADPANWVALISFFVASVVSSRLVVRARTQEANAEARRALLRAVSHDLSTPLTAIGLQVERLQRHLDPQTVTELAEQTDRLRRRIENLLAMARFDAGTFVPRPEPTPPADLFRAVREHLPLVTNLHIAVSDDCPDVYADPSLALEVLVNLVENAHRASPRGSVIELLAQPAGRRVRLEVLDRGSGIAGTESETGRRGLGLEIAKNFAAANGGAVSLTSRPGGGAMACVDLPAAVLPSISES